MPPAGVGPTIPASERPQNHTSYGAATGTVEIRDYWRKLYNEKFHTRTLYLSPNAVSMSTADARERREIQQPVRAIVLHWPGPWLDCKRQLSLSLVVRCYVRMT